MKVYRVENSEGVGPYNGHARIPLHYFGDSEARPGPDTDGIVHNSRYVYGFRSMRDLFAWFSGTLPSLKRQGYNVKVFDVPDNVVKHGSKQLCFPKEWRS